LKQVHAVYYSMNSLWSPSWPQTLDLSALANWVLWLHAQIICIFF
jgi:hypothetical protein